MTSRRQFLQMLAVAAAARPHLANANSKSRFGSLQSDKARVMDLPEGFSYRVIAQAGAEMSDGLLVPRRADGMAAFAAADGRIRIVCNHENIPAQQIAGPFGLDLSRVNLIERSRLYDAGDGVTPGTGGTTTIVYNPASRETEKQFLSLAGTELNCAGGSTPWGSWLSCEEVFADPGPAMQYGVLVQRDKRHGYIFEVPASSDGLVEPVPLKDLGRFEHEAAAVNPATGVVYLTEDRHRSLLYRFVPNVPGNLRRGGQLQALAMAGHDSFDTRNWTNAAGMPLNRWMATRWVGLEDVDGDSNDLRLRGHAAGAAIFARGEGLCFAGGSVFATCTIGGPAGLGQVFEYRVSANEGTVHEDVEPGQIRLVAQSDQQSILRNADNCTMSPWGDLIVCEDTQDHCGLVGLRPDGSQYPLADNAYTDSELAGVCFAPDNKTLFVNIQHTGLTLAITGPW